MEVYILIYHDHYENCDDMIGIFTSEEKAREYLLRYIHKYSIFEEKDFEIESHDLNPDSNWLEKQKGDKICQILIKKLQFRKISFII